MLALNSVSYYNNKNLIKYNSGHHAIRCSPLSRTLPNAGGGIIVREPVFRVDIHGVFLSPIIAAGLGPLILAAC